MTQLLTSEVLGHLEDITLLVGSLLVGFGLGYGIGSSSLNSPDDHGNV